MNILVSACLLGVNCRYDGKASFCEELAELKSKHNLIPICPEQISGLPTPRKPVEILKGKALTCDGEDFTEFFRKGAEASLKLAEFFSCETSVLKSKSPSCGYGLIYDGNFSKNLVQGKGFTAKLLDEKGIKILSEKDKEEILRLIKAKN